MASVKLKHAANSKHECLGVLGMALGNIKIQFFEIEFGINFGGKIIL